MNRSIEKILNTIRKIKIRQSKERFKKLRFSGYREDFVITAQEEREGGFFGSLNFKMISH